MITTDVRGGIPYEGNGSTLAFDIPWRVDDADHVQVFLVDADGVETETTATISGLGDPTATATLAAAPDTGVTVLIVPNVPATQPTNLRSQRFFNPETIERALDRLTLLVSGLPTRAALWARVTSMIESEEPGGVSGLLRSDLAASDGASHIGFIAAGGGAVPRTLDGKVRGLGVSAEDYGAVGGGGTDDAAAINLAIDAVSVIGGGTVYLENESYAVGQTGTHLAGTRGYCVMLKSGVTLEGKQAHGAVLQYTRTDETVDVVVTPQSGTLDAPGSESIGLRNVTVDGDSSSAAIGNGFNYWIFGVAGLLLENAGSVNSTNWGIRVEQCDGVHVDYAWTNHGPDVNGDGLHFVDCRNVTGSADIYTEGDDAFIIETLAYPVYNYDFTMIVRSPNNAAGGRGCLLHHETVQSAAPRAMKDMNLRLVAKDCESSALTINGSLELSNVNATVIADNCNDGMNIVLGDGVEAGTMDTCTINLLCRNPVQTGFVMALGTGSTADGNTINARIYNPGDGEVAATLQGSNWHGAINIDYNPNADKTIFNVGLDMQASDSVIDLSCRGAGTNCYVRVGADDNVFRLGQLDDAATADIEVVSGHTAGPVFIGGRITGAVTNPTLATFVGTKGAPTFNINQVPSGDYVQSSTTDSATDTAKLLRRGDWGLGAKTPPELDDVDSTAVMTGFYRYDTPSAGTLPATAATSGLIEVLRFGPGTFIEILYESSDLAQQWRRRYSGGFAAWQGPF